jgi:DNA-binding GntR family transcriptional regulator
MSSESERLMLLSACSKVAKERLTSTGGKFMLSRSCLEGPPSLSATIDCHLAVLEAVASRSVKAAIEATDAGMDFVDYMFDVMEREIDPALLDCSVLPVF